MRPGRSLGETGEDSKLLHAFRLGGIGTDQADLHSGHIRLYGSHCLNEFIAREAIKLPPHHDDVAREQVFRMLDLCNRTGMEG
jgi:hypothetical protein